MQKTQEELQYEEKLKEAAGNLETIGGHAFGPRPRYFIIGDYPNTRDAITHQPFSGTLRQVLERAIATLNKKDGATLADIYVTYLWKTVVDPRTITTKRIEEVWLPLAQMEFALSGCDSVVALGQIARTYAGNIAQRPFNPKKPSLIERIRSAWQVLTA